MTSPADISIESITYTHEDLHADMFHLDRLLDRMAPISSLIGQIPQVREIGALTILPAELLRTILESLSIIDLMRFRRCCRSSSYFIDTVLHTALRFAPNTLKGIMALQIPTHITAQQLHYKLRHRYCEKCGKLAQYLYLPTCSRACFTCVYPGYSMFGTPLEEDYVMKRFELGPEDYAALPSFKPLPAIFTNGLNKFKMEGHQRIYDNWSAFIDSKTGTSRPCLDADDDTRTRWREIVDRECSMYDQDPNRDGITVVHDPLPIILRMHMCVVFAPWPDSDGSRAEHGVFCSSCLYTKRQTQLHTREMFLEHLRDCRIKPNSSIFINKQLTDMVPLSLAADVD